MAFLDTLSNSYVSYPLVKITGKAGLLNPFNGAEYADDATANAATGGYTVKEFATLAAYQAALAANGGDVLKLYALGGRTPASVAVAPAPGGNGGGVITPGGSGFLGGILDGEIFGVNKKIVIGLAAAWFLLKD